MKTLFFLFTFICLSFAANEDCGDNIVYANKRQTEYDARFSAYTKIKGCPKFKGGESKLYDLIKKNMKLSDVAKTQIFFLNYTFTVTCKGKIKDIKELGDPKGFGWTNIIEIIKSTEGQWTPALKDKKSVDCVYFNRFMVYGNEY